MSKPLQILIDADMIVFQACSAVESPIEWEPDLWTLHADAGEAKAKVDDLVQAYSDKATKLMKHSGEYEIIMCFTDPENFRKKIYPLYKANRSGKLKPICYGAVKNWVSENFTCYQRPGLEADDCIGILSTLKPHTVIVSGDKDMKTIPGHFYDYGRDTFHSTSEEEADYWHLYQTLVGDTADNYPGCPGVGPKTAEKLLAADPSWQTVVDAFEKKGLTETDALTQARVARILRKQDYDFTSKHPILWTP